MPDSEELERLRLAIRRRPADLSQQLWTLAELVRQRGFAFAVTGFREIVALSPEWTQLHHDVLEYWTNRGRDPIAVLEAWERATGDRDTVFLYGYALALQMGRLHDRAIEVYRETLRLDPRSAVLHFNLGVTLDGLRQWSEAAPLLLRAVALSPTLAEPHMVLGLRYSMANRDEEAIAHFERFINLAYPYLETYIPKVDTSLHFLYEKTKRGPYRRFRNALRTSNGAVARFQK